MKRLIDYKSRFRILKGGKISLVISAILGSITITFASPTGGTVTSGTANISQIGNVTNITQSTSKATINWQNFSIAQNETVNFIQPNVNSITLNRVIGNETSIINGALNANGQVWILNSNGVLFGKNASINTAGLLSTTSKLSDANFNAGNYNFTDATSNSVINQGTIEISDGGYVVLASNEVRNEGTIKAVKGKVHLVGADSYSLNLNANSLVNLTIDKGVLDAMVSNSGTILADGGEIYLSTNAVDELLKSVVNNTGVIEANSLDDITGYVELYAHGGKADIDGDITAIGGFIETSGKELSVASTTNIKADKWLLDPTNIIIESSGEDDITVASVSATAIQNALAIADVILEADQDITVNEDITWAEDTKLTLTAGDEIYLNRAIENTNSTTGGVFFNADNTTDKVIFSIDGLVIVNNVFQLQWINQALNGYYTLGSSIDASVTSTWDSGAGFLPIYKFNEVGEPYGFNGTLDGLGYTIDGLTINRPTIDNNALVGKTMPTAIINNIGVINATIIGNKSTGALVGHNSGTISNSYSTGTVTGELFIGGLVGRNDGTVKNSYSIGTVNGSQYAGGLVGANSAGAEDDDGEEVYGLIENSYSSGSVKNATNVGGLVGFNQANITNSFWDTETSGQATSAGGTGKTTAEMQTASTFTNWGITSTDTAYPTLVTTNGVTSWGIVSLDTAVAYSLSDILTGYTYDGSQTSLNSLWNTASIFDGSTYDTWVYGTDYNFVYGGSTITGFTNAGSYTDISIAVLKDTFVADGASTKGSFTIAKKDITAITAITAENKVYDALTSATLDTTSAVFTGMISGDTLNVATSTGIFTDKNTGTAKTVNISGLTLGGEDASNYNLTSSTSSTTANITAKELSISGLTSTDKVYDGTTTASVVGTATLETALAGDTVSLDSTNALANFNDKDVADASTVSFSGLVLSGEDKDNYTIATHSLVNNVITKKSITVLADDLSKAEGSADGTFTYSSDEIEGSDTLEGSLQRASGEEIGEYVISQDTLANSNYDITVTNGTYTITPKPVPPTTPTPKPEVPEVIEPTPEPTPIPEAEVPEVVEPTPEPTPTPKPEVPEVVEPTPTEEAVNKVVSEIVKNIEIPKTIINNIVANTPKLETIKIQTPTMKRTNTNLAKNIGLGDSKINIVSKTNTGETANKVVTLAEIKTAMKENIDQGTQQNIRIPLSKNSIIDLVNGGVNLPDGVDQQFFVVEDDS